MGWLTETIYVDTVYESSIDQYLLRVNNPAMVYIRQQRQALKESQVEVRFLRNENSLLNVALAKSTEVSTEQAATILTLKQAFNTEKEANVAGDEEIAIHLGNLNHWKKQSRLWKGIAIGGATLVVVGAGTIAYILITTP